MEIIANNAIIVFRHLVKFAIFAVTNFFSLFGIAVFNVPISHIIVFFVVSDAKLLLFSLFPNFSLLFFNICAWISRQSQILFACFACVPPFSGGVPCPVLCWSWSCVSRSPDNHTHARAYIRAYTRAHGDF